MACRNCYKYPCCEYLKSPSDNKLYWSEEEKRLKCDCIYYKSKRIMLDEIEYKNILNNERNKICGV